MKKGSSSFSDPALSWAVQFSAATANLRQLAQYFFFFFLTMSYIYDGL